MKAGRSSKTAKKRFCRQLALVEDAEADDDGDEDEAAEEPSEGEAPDGSAAADEAPSEDGARVLEMPGSQVDGAD